MAMWSRYVNGETAAKVVPDSSGQAETVVIKIAITQAAFDALARPLPPSNVVYEIEANEHGERYVWLPPKVVDRLRAQRRPGESYSDVILRIAAEK